MAQNIDENLKDWYKPVLKGKWKGLIETWPEGTKYRLWDPEQDTSESISIKWHGGIDVHLKELTVALFGADLNHGFEKVLGPIIQVKTTQVGYKQLFEIFNFFSPIRILMETTGVYSFDPYYRCAAQFPSMANESKIICMNANDLKRLLVKNKKTDKIDAARLSFLASVPELLRKSYIPTREEYVLRFMLRQRNKHKVNLTKAKNRIKTFLAAGGFRWQFNYNVMGEMDIMDGFIKQNECFGEYLNHLKASLDTSREVKLAIKKYYKLMIQWSDFKISDMERLNLVALFGFLKKNKGLVDLYDKLVYEALICIPIFKKSWDLLKDLPGAGTWVLATIVLETGPISRFPRVGSYLSYVGVTKGIHESANVSKKKGNNPHSHRILKQAYRTIGIALLGMVIKAEKRNENPIFQQCHPIIQYARRINHLNILNGQKANKIAAKAARIVYGILKSEKSYNCYNEKRQDNAIMIQNEEVTQMVRHSVMDKQILLLKTSYQTIALRSSLVEDPYIEELITCCKNVVSHWDSKPLLLKLRKKSKILRKIKRPGKRAIVIKESENSLKNMRGRS